MREGEKHFSATFTCPVYKYLNLYNLQFTGFLKNVMSWEIVIKYDKNQHMIYLRRMMEHLYFAGERIT
jgi:hypothetical protein